jgi:hypothetical protein
MLDGVPRLLLLLLRHPQQQSNNIAMTKWCHAVTRRHQVVPLAAAKVRMKASFAMLMGVPAAEVRRDDVAPTGLVS